MIMGRGNGNHTFNNINKSQKNSPESHHYKEESSKGVSVLGKRQAPLKQAIYD